MLKPGFALFLCVVVAGCGGSLRELKAQLRAKRARALGLQVDECYGEQGSQCGYCYPEDQDNPKNWGQCHGQVSLPQPQLLQASSQYPVQDVSHHRFPGHPGMEPGHPFPGQMPMNQHFPGQQQSNQRFPGISPIVHNFPGQGPKSPILPGHDPTNQNFQQQPVGSCPAQEGLPPGVNAPYCFREDGQPRFQGIPPEISPAQTNFGHRWRSPLPLQPEEQAQQSSMPPAHASPYQYQQYPELPGAKVRKRLDALLHPPKQPSSKYSLHLSPNYHHPHAHHSSKFGDTQPPKMNVLHPPKMSSYPKFSDIMQPAESPEPKSSDLPPEWAQQLPYSKQQSNKYDRPSTTTTPKPLSDFFKDFMPKYVETVPPPTCPISPAYQEPEQQAPAPPKYEQQPDPSQPLSPYDQHTSHEHHSSLHHFDSPNGPHFGHRSHFMPKSYQ